MFKKTSDRLSYIERVASHSTKERANGRIDMIPADAKQPVDYFNTLHDQYKIMLNNYKLLMADAAALRARMQQRMTFEAYQQTNSQLDAIGCQMQHAQDQLAELRQLVRGARGEAAFAFKWHLAKVMLREQDVLQINKQSELFIAEHLTVLPNLKNKSTGEKTGERHANQAKRNKMSLHRRHARNNLEFAKCEGLSMYSNSNFKQGDAPDRFSVAVPTERLQALADRFNKK